MITTFNGKPITTVDIWSTMFSSCFNCGRYLDVVTKLEGKTLYTDILRRHYYFLTDSRYGKDYYL